MLISQETFSRRKEGIQWEGKFKRVHIVTSTRYLGFQGDMKKKKQILIFLSVVALCGCSQNKPVTSESSIAASNATLESQTVANAEQSSQMVTTENNDDNILEETHLELTALDDYCPVYSFALKKIEGRTGKELDFTDPQLVLEPADQFAGFIQVIDPKDPKTLTFSFWNVASNESVKVVYGDLEMDVPIPVTTGTEVTLNTKIEVNGEHTLLKTATIFPKALVLQLTDISSQKLFENSFFLLNNGELRPPYEFYENADGRMLVYVFKDGLNPESIQGITLGKDAEKISFDLSQN